MLEGATEDWGRRQGERAPPRKLADAADLVSPVPGHKHDTTSNMAGAILQAAPSVLGTRCHCHRSTSHSLLAPCPTALLLGHQPTLTAPSRELPWS